MYGGDEMKKNDQLILELTSNEKTFLEKTAKETSLSVSELVILSVLSLKTPIAPEDNNNDR